MACFVFLKHPFWDSPFCLITNELWPCYFILGYFLIITYVKAFFYFFDFWADTCLKSANRLPVQFSSKTLLDMCNEVMILFDQNDSMALMVLLNSVNRKYLVVLKALCKMHIQILVFFRSTFFDWFLVTDKYLC